MGFVLGYMRVYYNGLFPADVSKVNVPEISTEDTRASPFFFFFLLASISSFSVYVFLILWRFFYSFFPVGHLCRH